MRPKMEIQRVLSSYLSGDRLNATIIAMEKRPIITVLDNLTGITVRFKEIRVMDNHTSFITWDSPANVYVLAFFISDNGSKPFDFVCSKMYTDIKDNDILPDISQLDLTRTFNKAPHFQDIHMVVLKSNQKKRDIIKEVNEALTAPEGVAFSSTFNTSFANLATSDVLHTGTSLLSYLFNALHQDGDDQLFYGIISLEDDPDDLGLGRVWVLTDNKNVRVTFEIIGKLIDDKNFRK